MVISSLYIARTNQTPLGCVEVRAGNYGLTNVFLFGKNPPFKADEILPSSQDPAMIALTQIMEYLDGKRREFELTIDWMFIRGFQHDVLKRTLEIPYGETTTYNKIADDLENPFASRAVGGALANNPIPIVIPCHRVIAKDGKLTGFSAADGIRAKKWLLELEGHKF
jgi:methylated-DNA-[protein]-cysteine S-methyltransferase